MSLRVTEEEFKGFLVKVGAASSVTTQPVTTNKPRLKDRRITIDGETFGSKGEYGYYLVLQMRQTAGEISDLEKQITIPIVINGEHVCSYRADYVYMRKGVRVVVDYKGLVTEMYALKKNLLRALYGIEIEEVRKRKK